MAYGGPGAAGRGVQPIGGLTKWLVVLLGVSVAVQAAMLVTQLSLRGAAADRVAQTITASDFKSKIGLYLAIAAVFAFMTIAQGVILIIWTFRMAKNHVLLGRIPQSFSAGLTIVVNILGGCTLGIANYFMWREIWKASDPTTLAGDPTWKQRVVSPLVAVHLGLTLAGVVVGFFVGTAVSFKTNSSDQVATNIRDRLPIVALAGVLQIAAAVVFIVLARQIAARHMQTTREA